MKEKLDIVRKGVSVPHVAGPPTTCPTSSVRYLPITADISAVGRLSVVDVTVHTNAGVMLCDRICMIPLSVEGA